MTNEPPAESPIPSTRRHGFSSVLIGAVIILVVGASVAVSIIFVMNYSTRSTYFPLTSVTPSGYPIGPSDSNEPSGHAPPGPRSLAGFNLAYVSDFTGATLPAGWNVYTGVPGGDPGGQFGAKHVVVRNGMLQLNTWKDPGYQNRWVTGGLCQCGVPRTYGAYFVRLRITGPGPNAVALLWPSDNSWPPENDFLETGGSTNSAWSTIHWSPINQIDQRHINVDLTQWHTWGVIWTPAAVTYVVDGQIWGQITSPEEITRRPMTLDVQQVTECDLGRQCPAHPVSMLIDWVVEYSPK